MRKLLLTVLLASPFTMLFAQKVEDVEEKFSKGKVDEAKEKIDKIMADPKNKDNSRAWYWKGKVYTELARLDSTNALPYDAAAEAFDAYKRYQALDQKNLLMAIEQNVGLFQLYDMHYNKGIKSYNDKDYAKSFTRMKRAMELEEYIAKKGYSYNGFSFPALDTQLINLTASAGFLAKNEDEAIPYFEKLADAKIKDKEYKEIYGVLAEYYLKKKDPKADKYLALGKELYPDNDYWISLEFGDPGTDTVKRFARYEEMIQKYPGNYALAMDYAIELFNYTYANEKKPADYADRQEKLASALTKALSAKSTAIANFVMSQHIYNQIYDLEDIQRAIRGTTAADTKKKADVKARLDVKYEELQKYASAAYDLYSAQTLKAQDKANLRKVIDELVDYYSRKNQQDKVALYKEKLKSL
jgi:hypothetical protein